MPRSPLVTTCEIGPHLALCSQRRSPQWVVGAPARDDHRLATLLEERMTLDVRALGGVKAKRLFDVLLAARGAVVSRTRLVELLWGEEPPRNAAGSIDAYVMVLRHRIQPGVAERDSVIVRDGEGFRFDPSRATAAAVDRVAESALTGSA